MAGLALLLALTGAGLPAQQAPARSAAPPQTLRVAFTFPAQTFDPLGNGSLIDSILQRQVYESLLEFAYGAADYRTLAPLLAAHHEASADGRMWVFVLKDGAAFYDPFEPPLWPERKRPVTAWDVVYSWMRQADADQGGSPHHWFEGLIAGLDQFHAETAAGRGAAAWAAAEAVGGLADLRALDERCLLVRLTRPEPTFGYRVATSYSAIVAHEAVRRSGADFLNQPVGSGPYFVAEWIPGSQVRFQRVPGWRGDPCPNGRGAMPFVDEIRIQFVAEASTRTQLFEAEQLDFLQVQPDSYAKLLEQGQPNAALRRRGVRALRQIPTGLSMLTLNLEDPVLGLIPGDEEGNARRTCLRQALALAFPYERWHEQVRNGDGALAARTFVLPHLAGGAQLPEFAYGVAAGAPAQRLARARELLAAAGYPEGRGLPELTVDLAPADRLNRLIGEMLADSWGRIGVRCRLELGNWNETVQRTIEGRFQIFPRNWAMDNPDPGMLLDIFYGAFESSTNRCRMRDAEYDAAYAAYRTSIDPAERARLVTALSERLNALVPVIPIDFPSGVLLQQPWIENMQVHPFEPYRFKFYRLRTH